MSLQHFQLRIVCLGVATFQLFASSQRVDATPEFASLAGAWKGQGEILGACPRKAPEGHALA
jgi:hypothetical protein